MTRDGKRAFVGLGKANHVAFVDVASAQGDRPGAGGQARLGRGAWTRPRRRCCGQRPVRRHEHRRRGQRQGAKTVKVGRVPHSVVVVE
jgi:hypothetical protein